MVLGLSDGAGGGRGVGVEGRGGGGNCRSDMDGSNFVPGQYSFIYIVHMNLIIT